VLDVQVVRELDLVDLAVAAYQDCHETLLGLVDQRLDELPRLDAEELRDLLDRLLTGSRNLFQLLRLANTTPNPRKTPSDSSLAKGRAISLGCRLSSDFTKRR
jgi:hypothetical protein